MRLIKGFITIIGVIGVLVIIGLLMGYYLFSLTPWIQARVLPVAITAEAAQSLDQKLESLETEIEEAAEAGEERELSLVITEKEINSKLVEVLAEGELPLKEILINLGEGYFIIYTIVDNPGVNAKTGAVGQLKVVNGDPKVVVEDFDWANCPYHKLRIRELENCWIS